MKIKIYIARALSYKELLFLHLISSTRTLRDSYAAKGLSALRLKETPRKIVKPAT